MNFLKDMTGNRRFPILETAGIDQDLYNSIDKYEMWKEAYFLHLHNPDERFTASDFQMINEEAESYVQRTPEQELLERFYEQSDSLSGTFMTVTDLLNGLQSKTTLRNLSPEKLGKVIKKMGWKKFQKGRDNWKRPGYYVSEI
jgi:predicted P-loop ATPase